MVRIGVMHAIPAVLTSLGCNPAEVLAEVGVDPALFDDPDNLIVRTARGRVFDHCVARTGCGHFGLRLGQQGGLGSFGLVGALVTYSPDVGTAMRNLVRYLHLRVRGSAPTLAVDAGSVTFGYDIYAPEVEDTHQYADGAVAVMFNIARALCGPEWKPVEVRFAHPRPDNDRPFRRFFRAPLRFDAEQYALRFPADWLDRPIPGADRELLALVQRQIDALEARYRADPPELVRRVLRTALLTGRFKAEHVAALFAMHSRTLSRRLKTCGTSFKQLADEGRHEIARQMLDDPHLEIGTIAASLDYADASAFTRAFRRWTGTSPGRWRLDRTAASGYDAGLARGAAA